jgi:L-aspartate oxidase
VAPAAHYLMGGIATDLDGRSSLPGLYAVGECACTGLHGANRIASNSLAECVVFAYRAVAAAAREPAPRERGRERPALAPSPVPEQRTREALWRLAGLRRTPDGLDELSRDPFPLASAVGACGLARRESRGAHQRSDCPREDPELEQTHTVLELGQAPRLVRWD